MNCIKMKYQKAFHLTRKRKTPPPPFVFHLTPHASLLWHHLLLVIILLLFLSSLYQFWHELEEGGNESLVISVFVFLLLKYSYC